MRCRRNRSRMIERATPALAYGRNPSIGGHLRAFMPEDARQCLVSCTNTSRAIRVEYSRHHIVATVRIEPGEQLLDVIRDRVRRYA
jgi:hypothetical protein